MKVTQHHLTRWQKQQAHCRMKRFISRLANGNNNRLRGSALAYFLCETAITEIASDKIPCVTGSNSRK
jgi:hypothetical protein